MQDTDAQGLRLVSFCPVCEMRAPSMHARTLGARGETKLMHVQCEKCHNAFLSLVLVNDIGASSIGLITDLAYEDVLRFTSTPNVSVNDVINAHKYFEKGMFHVSVERKRSMRSKAPAKRVRKHVGK